MDADISKTVKNKGSAPKDHQQEMAYRKSNGHVTEIQDVGLSEICSLRMLFLVYSYTLHF